MSLDVPICKNSPLSGVLPPIIPSRLGKPRPRSVDRLDIRGVADAVVVRSDAYNWAVLLVQVYVVALKMAIPDSVKVP